MGEQETFQERLARIAAEKAGAQENSGGKKRSTHSAAGIPSFRENIGYPLSFVRAALVGMVAVFLSRYIRFQLTGGTLSGGAEGADIFMMIDGAIAASAGFALKEVFRIQDKTLQMAQTVGVVMMLLLMHNLVHIAPNLFANVFSPEWTQDVLDTSEPNSVLFRGVSFMLTGDPVQSRQIEFPTIQEYPDISDY